MYSFLYSFGFCLSSSDVLSYWFFLCFRILFFPYLIFLSLLILRHFLQRFLVIFIILFFFATFLMIEIMILCLLFIFSSILFCGNFIHFIMRYKNDIFLFIMIVNFLVKSAFFHPTHGFKELLTYFNVTVKKCILTFTKTLFFICLSLSRHYINLKTFHIISSSCTWFSTDKYLLEKNLLCWII